MKNRISFLTAVIAAFAFTACANGKKLQEQKPPALEQPFYTTWTGGVKTAGSGLNFYVPVKNDEIQLDSVYFRGKRAKLESPPQDAVSSPYPRVYVAYFRTATRQKAPDLIMHRDPREEYGNQVPEVKEEIPFELEDDEAVISYITNGEVKYFKVSGIRPQSEGSNIKIKRPQDLQH